MSLHSIYILALTQGRDLDEYGNLTIILPYKWSFFLYTPPPTPTTPTSKEEVTGTIYSLSGIRGTHWYGGPHFYQTIEPENVRAVLEIGQFTDDDVMKFEKVLENVDIVNDEILEWGCTDWCLEGIRGCVERGLVGEEFSTENVKELLRERVEYEVEYEED